MNKKLEKSLVEIRKVLQNDGGDLEVVNFDEKNNILDINLLGVCQKCPMAEITIKGFVEEQLRKDFPKIQVKRVN